jgi:hypothetical protein
MVMKINEENIIMGQLRTWSFECTETKIVKRMRKITTGPGIHCAEGWVNSRASERYEKDYLYQLSYPGSQRASRF